MSLTYRVEGEGSRVATAFTLEGADGLGKCSVTVRVGAQVLRVGQLRAAS